jgi:hypothetical protein
VLKNRVLKKILLPKGEEVRGGWIKFHNGERHNIFNITGPVTENSKI